VAEVAPDVFQIGNDRDVLIDVEQSHAGTRTAVSFFVHL
jgi:hypothetical protein